MPPGEWDAIVRALERGNNTLVFGARGAGKTTLLRQLQLTLREDQRTVFVNATALSEPLELVERVRDTLKGRPGAAASAITPAMVAEIAGDHSPPPGGASRELYDALLDLGHGTEPAIVLLDASASPQAIYGVFGACATRSGSSRTTGSWPSTTRTARPH